jgi:hypothetical protein
MDTSSNIQPAQPESSETEQNIARLDTLELHSENPLEQLEQIIRFERLRLSEQHDEKEIIVFEEAARLAVDRLKQHLSLCNQGGHA